MCLTCIRISNDIRYNNRKCISLSLSHNIHMLYDVIHINMMYKEPYVLSLMTPVIYCVIIAFT